MDARWTAKPRYGTKLDRSHPWAQGLVSFYACNEGGGPIVHDACGRMDLRARNFGAVSPWVTGGSSFGVANVSNTSCFAGSLAGTGVAGSSPLQPAYPMAMAFGGRLLTAAGAGPFLCIFADEVTFSGARRFGISINLQQTMFQVTRGTAATLNVTTQAPAIQVGEEFVILYQAWPVGLEVWQDGVRTRSLPDANPDFDYGPTPFLGLAGFPGANSLTTLISPGLWAAWWRRPISAQEAQAITASPAAIWRMFRAPTRHISLPPTEPPAATLRRRSLYLRTGSRGQRV